jgi:hypothetical protein
MFIFYELNLFCIETARVIYRKIRYFNSTGYRTYRYPVSIPSILLALLVSSLCLSHCCLCHSIFLPHCIPLDGRLGSRLRDYRPVAPRPISCRPSVHCLCSYACHLQRRSKPRDKRDPCKGRTEWPTILVSSTPNEGFFYMPQICDMGLTALLPLRRKAC